MLRLVAALALTGLFAFPGSALAFGPSFGLDADIGQLNTGLYDSDPASNAPNAGGVWTDLTGSNFSFRPGVVVRSGESRFRVIRSPRITVTP